MGVNSLPKTVTRQRRGCDLNPGPSANHSAIEYGLPFLLPFSAPLLPLPICTVYSRHLFCGRGEEFTSPKQTYISPKRVRNV